MTAPDQQQVIADAIREGLDEWLFRMHGLTSSCDHRVEADAIAEAVVAALAAFNAGTDPACDYPECALDDDKCAAKVMALTGTDHAEGALDEVERRLDEVFDESERESGDARFAYRIVREVRAAAGGTP